MQIRILLINTVVFHFTNLLMNTSEQKITAEKEEWSKPEMEVTSIATGTLGAGASGDDGFDAGTS